MLKAKKKAYISSECVACGCCVKECPIDAVSIHKGIYAIADDQKCVGCGKCEKSCPASVISIITREDSEHEAKALV